MGDRYTIFIYTRISLRQLCGDSKNKPTLQKWTNADCSWLVVRSRTNLSATFRKRKCFGWRKTIDNTLRNNANKFVFSPHSASICREKNNGRRMVDNVEVLTTLVTCHVYGIRMLMSNGGLRRNETIIYGVAYSWCNPATWRLGSVFWASWQHNTYIYWPTVDQPWPEITSLTIVIEIKDHIRKTPT